MPFDPNRAVPADEANISPTTLVMNFLQGKGMSPSNPNFSQAVRSALEQNARQPGYIPGLGNNAPSTEAEDQAAMAAAGKGRGGGARAGLPLPPDPPAGGLSGPMDKRDASTDTSAQPPAGGSGGMSLGQMIGVGVPATAAGLWGASKLLNGSGGGNAVAGGIPLPPSAPELGGPGGAPTGLEPAVMDKAMAPAGPEPMPGVQPIPPTMGANNPVGPTAPDPAIANEAAIHAGGPAPNVPFQPRPVGAPRVAPPEASPMLAERILKGLAGGLRGARIP